MTATITASKITTYLMCARKFAFRYVEEIPPAWKSSALAFGSAIHSALEAFHSAKKDGRLMSAEEVATIFLSDWQAAQLDELHFKEGEDGASLRDLGLALVTRYVESAGDLKVREVESRFEIPLVDETTGEVLGPSLRGVFDLILDGHVVVELKTAARAWDETAMSRNLQLTAYSYAYWSLHQVMPWLQVTALLKYKRPKIDRYRAGRTSEEHAWFVHLAATIARGIETEVFPPNPGWLCNDCEYLAPCSGWRGRTFHLPIVNSSPNP